MPEDDLSEQLATVWPVDKNLSPDVPQEIVTLLSVPDATGYVATVYRTWVTDVDGSGLEEDQMDPVLILRGPDQDLETFHGRAVAELEFRRIVDYEVADMFISDP